MHIHCSTFQPQKHYHHWYIYSFRCGSIRPLLLLSLQVAVASKQLYHDKIRGAHIRSKYYRDPLVTSSLVEHEGCISMLREKITANLESYAGCQLRPFQDTAVKSPVFFWHPIAWRASRSCSVLKIFFPSNSSWQMKSPAHCLYMWLSGSMGKGSKTHTKLHHTLPGKV